MNTPRICFVGPGNLAALAREHGSSRMDGESLQQALLARALARRGYRVSMIVGDHGQSDGAAWDGVTTHIAAGLEDPRPGACSPLRRWQGLWSAARKADADVYYVSGAGMHVGELAMFTRQHARRMVLRVVHDDDCVPHRLAGRLSLAGPRLWMEAALYRSGLARADAVLVQSEQQRRELLQRYHRDGSVARKLVDMPRRRLAFHERDIQVLWINNLRPFKRGDLAIDLAMALGDLPVHMVGGCQPGFEAHHAQIRRRAAATPNLTFHGPAPCHQASAYHDRARVLANTSDSEGFPNSYLQAWARGVPVVTFFDPDGVIARHGLGVVARNLYEMKEAVRVLATDSEAWQQASQRCLAHVKREYGEERVLAPYVAAIDNLSPSVLAGAMMAR